jgi:hypothetical protein
VRINKLRKRNKSVKTEKCKKLEINDKFLIKKKIYIYFFSSHKKNVLLYSQNSVLTKTSRSSAKALVS